MRLRKVVGGDGVTASDQCSSFSEPLSLVRGGVLGQVGVDVSSTSHSGKSEDSGSGVDGSLFVLIVSLEVSRRCFWMRGMPRPVGDGDSEEDGEEFRGDDGSWKD